MTFTQTTSNQPQLIEVAKLEKSPQNARKTTGPEGINELKASILSHGLMQNLVVTATDGETYLVIAGARRLEAILSLQAEGKLPADYAVPCQVVSDEHALEMSLAENLVRLAMHPADQFQTFAELIDKGATAAEVAERFGIDEGLVHKRMKLARVAPELLQEYRNGGMTLECLMAYTVTDDHRSQRKVSKSLHAWQKDDPSAIRAALTDRLIEGDSKLALFVGIDAYTAAGGSTRADLFGEEVYLEKPALLNKLAEKKLDGIRKELEAEGWKWIEINPERDWNLINRCTRIKPVLGSAPNELIELKLELDQQLEEVEQAFEVDESDELEARQHSIQEQLQAVEEKLVTFVGFDAEQKELAGCFVSIGQDGTPFIEKGLVKPEQRKQLAKLLGDEGSIEDSVRTKSKAPFSESLSRELASERLQVAQIALAKHPVIALDLLVFQAASAVIDRSPAIDGANVAFNLPRKPFSKDVQSEDVDLGLNDIGKQLAAQWHAEGTETERFEALRSLSQEAKLDLLAYCMARTLKAKLAPTDGNEPTAYDVALSLTGADVATSWRPSKDNFLGRLSRDQLLNVGRDVLGEAWARDHANDKKSLLVHHLDRGFSNPEKSGRTAEQIGRLKTWLPEGMSFTIPSSPARAKVKKTKKAA